MAYTAETPLSQIAEDLGVSVSALVESIKGLVPKPAPVPTPSPEPAPSPVTPPAPKERPWVWASVGSPVDSNKSRNTPGSVRHIQDVLKTEFPVANWGDEHGVYWGPKTQQGYRWWQEKLFGAGPDADGFVGKTSLTKLAEKYKFDIKGDFPVPYTVEPAHNYARTTYGGYRVNQRTKVMLQYAASVYGGSINITQGSYNAGGVSASAGTHDGGGVVDISVSGLSSSQRNNLCLALRKVGFAAWIRTPSEGFVYHIHACAIGDREMASSARSQVRDYFNHRSGLVSNAYDSMAHPYPSWVNKYK